jgi:hypothetical protein
LAFSDQLSVFPHRVSFNPLIVILRPSRGQRTLPGLSSWVSASCAGVCLVVHRTATASSADAVGLGVAIMVPLAFLRRVVASRRALGGRFEGGRGHTACRNCWFPWLSQRSANEFVYINRMARHTHLV